MVKTQSQSQTDQRNMNYVDFELILPSKMKQPT